MESKHEALEKMYFWLVVRDHLPDGDSLAEQATGQEQEAKEVAGIITRQRGRQLDQQHRPLITQLVPARRDAMQPRLWRVQLAGMGQAARCLDRQPKPSGNLSRQLLNAAGRGQR